MAQGRITEDTIQYTVDVKSSKAQQEILKLETRMKDLRGENQKRLTQMLKLEAQGKKEEADYKRLRAEYNACNKSIRMLNEQIATQTNNLSTNVMTMNQLRKQAKILQRQLDDTAKATDPDSYKALENRLREVKARMGELKDSATSMREVMESRGFLEVLSGNLFIKVGELAGKAVSQLLDFADAGVEMARSADGVTKAFNDLNKPGLLDNLRAATKGTVTDVELMKAAVQAKDFRIPLEDLGKYLQFAQLKAQQTGQSVEYMTESIVTGLGRKSVMILDNLGLSAAEINEKVKQTGDFMEAVASVVDNQLAAAGENYVSAADRALQKTTELQNAQKEFGDALLPIKDEFDNFFIDMQVGAMNSIKTLIKYKEVVGIVISTLLGLVLAHAKAAIAAKAHTAATTSLNVVQTAGIAIQKTLKGVYLLASVAVLKLRGDTAKATATMRLFNITCKANVIGAVITAVTALVTYLVVFRKKTDDATKATKELTAEQQELNRVQAETNAQLQKDIATLNTFKGSKEQEIELVKQMNARYGESMGYYKSVQEWYNALVRNSKAYCEQMVIEAQVRSLANQAAQAEQEAYNITKDSQGRTRKYSKKRQTERVATGQVDAGDGKIITTYETREKAGSSDLEKAQASYNQKMKEANALKARMNQLLEKQLKLQTQLKTGAKTDPFIVSTPSPAKTKSAGASSDSRSGQTEDPEAALKAQIEALQQYYDQVEQVTAMGEQEVQMTLTAQRQAELETLRAYVQTGLELARQAGADENAIVEAGKRAKEAIIKKYADKELELAQATEEKKQQAREQLGLDQKTELELQTERLKEALDQQYITQEEYEKQVQKLKKQSYEKQAQMYQQLFSSAVMALQDAEMANVDAKYDAQIEAARQAGEDTTELENKKAQEKLNIEKKYADVNFAIKASQIISDTAVSIMKAYAELGPIAGSVAAALMGITGAAQLAAANAERERVKKMTLSGSTSTSASGSRVATGLESGGRIDVERRQDGKLFNAYYDPNRRGFIDRPTVIVGEGPAGQSREWVASNAAVTNPTIAPLLDVIDRAQTNGTVRTLDLRRFLALQSVGRSNGGTITATENSSSPSARTQANVTTQPVTSLSEKTMAKLADAIDRMTTDGVAAIVGLDEFDARQRLRSRSRAIGSKN